MPTRIAIVQGHPDPSPGRYCRALADAYAEGATAAGHAVDRIDLAHSDFPLLRTQDEFEHAAVPESLAGAVEAIRAADHIVIVFPLWLGTMPALLKAFLEQALRPGIAFEYRPNGLPKTLWGGKSARLVVTMGMPAIAFRWWHGAHGLKALEHGALRFVGIRPIRTTLYGLVHKAGGRKRAEWLEQMRGLGGKGR